MLGGLHIAREFNDGKFTVQKTNRVFSAIATDYVHEQNNALVKGEGGAVGLTDNSSALRRWMVAGPEVARVIEEFHDQQYHCGGEVNIRHHDQTSSVQDAFAKDVRFLVSVMKKLGNPFEESTDLLAIDTKEISGHSFVDAVRNVRIGREQFQKFTKEQLISLRHLTTWAIFMAIHILSNPRGKSGGILSLRKPSLSTISF